MYAYEEKYLASGLRLIAGTDEVGRGCLAGPVVAAAVIFPPNYRNNLINDSKKLSANQRSKLFSVIKQDALSFAIAEVSPQEIDRTNIKLASRLAMKKAIELLSLTPDFVLVDYEKLDIVIRQENITKGDQKSVSIAAASILAKVTRDELMTKYGQEYPAYGFEKHFGYGTKQHYQAIAQFGATKIHRLSFKIYK